MSEPTLPFDASEDTVTKRCKTCGQDKPAAEFYRDKQNSDGLRAHCKVCWNASSKKHRLDNIEVVLERERAFRENNRALVRERGLQWWRENKEHVADYQRRYSSELLSQCLAHYGTACACCGSTDWPTIDHINGDGGEHRRELFGSDKAAGRQFYRWLIRNDFPEGYQTLCFPCNSSKGQTGGCRKDHSTDGDQLAG